MALLVAGGLFLAGCAAPGNSESSDIEAEEARRAAEEAAQAAPAVSVPDGAEDVDPNDRIQVTSPSGLESVSMVNSQGKEVEGELSQDQTAWSTTEDLGFYKTYTVTAVGKNGKSTESSLSTAEPDNLITMNYNVGDGDVVGVAHVLSFQFSQAPENREAVEEAIHITNDKNIEGAFHWMNGSLLRWRPAEFWPSGTTIEVDADMYGKDFGNGLGGNDARVTYSIGDRVEAVVDDNTHQMTVSKNGEVLRTIPVSMGRGKYATYNGIYYTSEEYDHLVMDSSTYGLDPEEGGYRTPVRFATRLSWSGVFVHGAPWASWALGSYNQSHGCINVTDADAEWFMQTVKPGDPLTVMNSEGPDLRPLEGQGDWNMSWDEWTSTDQPEG